MNNFLGKYVNDQNLTKEENLNISIIMDKTENIFQESLSPDGFIGSTVDLVKNRYILYNSGI